MLLKAHMTLHSRMSGSRWVITTSWLSGSWRSFLHSYVYSCYHFLISSAYFFSLISLHWSLRKAFLSRFAILWNSSFRWVYLSFPPLLFWFWWLPSMNHIKCYLYPCTIPATWASGWHETIGCYVRDTVSVTDPVFVCLFVCLFVFNIQPLFFPDSIAMLLIYNTL